MKRAPAITYPALKDRELSIKFNEHAASIHRPPHLLLARIVRDYLWDMNGLAACGSCGFPKPDVQAYKRAHIAGEFCRICRDRTDASLDRMEARARGEMVLEEPEPHMWAGPHR